MIYDFDQVGLRLEYLNSELVYSQQQSSSRG